MSDQSPPRDEPPRGHELPAERRQAPSLVLVLTGDGKGKSSSAFGTMIRAVSRDWKVAVVQTIKDNRWRVGEEDIGRRLGVDWWALGDGFTWDSDDMDETQARGREAWEAAKRIIVAGEHDMVILDEATYLMAWGWVDVDEVVAAIRDRPEHVNVVVTGRDAPPELIEIADTVSEVVSIKHAYEQGITARRGIDY